MSIFIYISNELKIDSSYQILMKLCNNNIELLKIFKTHFFIAFIAFYLIVLIAFNNTLEVIAMTKNDCLSYA